jgi:hypothetical protein
MGKKKRKEGEEGKKVNRDFRGDDRGHILTHNLREGIVQRSLDRQDIHPSRELLRAGVRLAAGWAPYESEWPHAD